MPDRAGCRTSRRDLSGAWLVPCMIPRSPTVCSSQASTLLLNSLRPLCLKRRPLVQQLVCSRHLLRGKISEHSTTTRSHISNVISRSKCHRKNKLSVTNSSHNCTYVFGYWSGRLGIANAIYALSRPKHDYHYLTWSLTVFCSKFASPTAA